MEEVPVGWELFCAARPLYGHKTWEGAWCHDRHWAIINPNGDRADLMQQETIALDGWRVFWATLSDVEAFSRERAKEADVTYKELCEYYDLESRVADFQRYWSGKSVTEALA